MKSYRVMALPYTKGKSAVWEIREVGCPTLADVVAAADEEFLDVPLHKLEVVTTSDNGSQTIALRAITA